MILKDFIDATDDKKSWKAYFAAFINEANEWSVKSSNVIRKKLQIITGLDN